MSATVPIPPVEAETHHASPEVCTFFASFFNAKNLHDVDATMRHFSPGVVTYTDATFGWPLDGFDAIEGIFRQYMPTWPVDALSYPTRILGDSGSALVAFTDMPDLFGGELRILGAVDFEDGKVVRWVDYWDSTTFETERYEQMRTPEEAFPTDFKERSIGSNAAPAMVATATQLQRAWAAGDAHAATQLFSDDAAYEDMALRVRILGRAEIERYLARALAKAPYGNGSELRHVVGSAVGGGFEWFAVPGSPVRGGITALEIDASGGISRLTSVYDGRHLHEADRRVLVLLAAGLDD